MPGSVPHNHVVRIKRTIDGVKPPTRATLKAAGFDLYAAGPAKIEPRGRARISTGWIFELPDNSYGRIAPKSGNGVGLE